MKGDRLEKLRAEVLEANLELPREGLVAGTAGNASGIDRENGVFIIKPSGVAYSKMTGDDLVTMDMEGKVVAGRMKPSVDWPHHLEIYRRMPNVGGVIHTHSAYASMFAMLCRSIPVYSTAHADIFGAEIPCAPYVDNRADHIGKAIMEHAVEGCPAILLGCHGVFTFESTPLKALKAAVMLEYAAFTTKGALELAATLGEKLEPFPESRVRLWYARHHGGGYGQEES
ncbi:MAG TPA: class II aldolase/adducin family protein [Candidatus Brocadiia bacterium]|nr:class II aldolase/adducin family protein [Candidatus Brocadiia bacterium]